MTVAEVRKRYLQFFKQEGHVIIPSAPIVPGNDPTTLFTSSGMQPLLPYFLGKDHPEGKRVADSQMSFRAGDIEEVGDNRHTTFFEMLGNWSFGDYFKKEQLPWLFTFLTDPEHGLGLPADKLYVTVFAGDSESGMQADTESVDLWQQLFSAQGIDSTFVELGTEEGGYEKGMQGGRIFSYGAKKNWWSRAGVPTNMPAGEPGGPDSEVFFDFGTPHDTKWGANCHPNCDCGRFVEIGNSVFMQFIKNADGSFSELPKKNVDFGGGLERLAFATLGVADAFLIDVFDAARKVLEMKTGKKYGEDEQTTRSMRIILDHMRAASFMLAEGVIPANTEAGYVLRRLIRRSIREADRLGIQEAILPAIAEGYGAAYADQYPHVAANAEKIRSELAKEEEKFRITLVAGLQRLEKWIPGITPNASWGVPDMQFAFDLFQSFGFPPELIMEEMTKRGISFDPAEFMEEFNKLMKEHQDVSRAGGAQRFAGGLADHAEQTVRYHTTHHILLAALRKVLGNDVHQRGSNITAERLRIDFSHGAKMTDEEKAAVEKMVDDIIWSDLPVSRTVMPREEAEQLGAEMEFGVKYPDMVSVYSVGPIDATEADPKIPQAFSLEFCGGPHVTNTSEIHAGGTHFKIKKEEASSAGVRRIKAVME